MMGGNDVYQQVIDQIKRFSKEGKKKEKTESWKVGCETGSLLDAYTCDFD